MRALGAVTAVCLLLIAAVAGQSPTQTPAQTPVFRGGTDLVQLTVRVLDRDRKPVRGLVASDFTILIDGTTQPIDAAAAEDIAGPLKPSAPWMHDVAPDVATNNLANPRLIVVIMDDAMYSASHADGWSFRAIKQTATAIVNALGPLDLASIVFTGDNREPQDFTNDPARLLSAVERFHDTGIPPELAVRYSQATLKAAVTYLSAMPDRPSAVLWITDPGPVAGLGKKLTDLAHGMTVTEDLASMVGAARLKSVAVYPINFQGLLPITPQNMNMPIAMRNLGNEQMQRFAAAMGGRAIVNTNNIAGAVPGIFEENGLQYLVGYHATYPLADGRYRRLQVKVNRPGVIVEPAERMFRSPTAAAAATPAGPATTVAMSGIIPRSDEPLRLAVASFAAPPAVSGGGTSAAVSLALGIDLAGPGGQRIAGDTLDLELRVFDGEGRKQIDERHATVDLGGRLGQSGSQYDWLETLTLKPGRYNLRVSTHSVARNRSGSVYTDMVVPDFAKSPLSMSGVIITATPGRIATPAAALRDVLPLTPTTAREFAGTDRVTAFLRVYWGAGQAAVPVALHADIIDTKNATVFTQTDVLTPTAGSRPPSADYRLALPLARLAPGECVLTLRATPLKGVEIRRDIRVAVR